MANRKPSYVQRKQKETVNKKAIIWVGSIIGAIVLLMIVLLIWNP
ncbi:hypothetical protein ACFFNY_15570 [Paenibacillus hodogayensis]|uniref:DUF4044 domain-containing protein n=1 Tax=Paenibacillus hodogayensis TaxID=279208 RepID=A0ABV5VXL0_9BACL